MVGLIDGGEVEGGDEEDGREDCWGAEGEGAEDFFAMREEVDGEEPTNEGGGGGEDGLGVAVVGDACDVHDEEGEGDGEGDEFGGVELGSFVV